MIFKGKAEKFKKSLRDNSIDGAIILSPENFFYLTGLSGHQLSVSRQPGFSLAVTDNTVEGKIFVTTMDFEMATFRSLINQGDYLTGLSLQEYSTWVGAQPKEILLDKMPFPYKEPRDSFTILKEFIHSLNLNKSRLGIEKEHVNLNYYQKLKQAFPEAEFVDISPLLVDLRSIKDADEIEIFRTLCHEADKAFLAVSKIAGIGVSEAELVQCFKDNVIKGGICLPSTWSMFSAGANSAQLALPTQRKAQLGDVIKFDAGVNAGFQFYTTDTSRSWVLEGAPKELYNLKDRLYEAQRMMIAAMAPGLKISELFNLGYNYVKAQYPNYIRGHLGHSISLGPATAEDPYITSSNHRELEPGMILAVEVPFYMTGYNGFNIEDMVLITDKGSEVLTPMTPHYLP